MKLTINELYSEGFITRGQRDSIVMMYGDEVDITWSERFDRLVDEALSINLPIKPAIATNHLYDGEVRKSKDNKEESSGAGVTKSDLAHEIFSRCLMMSSDELRTLLTVTPPRSEENKK